MKRAYVIKNIRVFLEASLMQVSLWRTKWYAKFVYRKCRNQLIACSKQHESGNQIPMTFACSTLAPGFWWACCKYLGWFEVLSWNFFSDNFNFCLSQIQLTDTFHICYVLKYLKFHLFTTELFLCSIRIFIMELFCDNLTFVTMHWIIDCCFFIYLLPWIYVLIIFTIDV